MDKSSLEDSSWVSELAKQLSWLQHILQKLLPRVFVVFASVSSVVPLPGNHVGLLCELWHLSSHLQQC
jgi:hypothetical protein